MRHSVDHHDTRSIDKLATGSDGNSFFEDCQQLEQAIDLDKQATEVVSSPPAAKGAITGLSTALLQDHISVICINEWDNTCSPPTETNLAIGSYRSFVVGNLCRALQMNKVAAEEAFALRRLSMRLANETGLRLSKARSMYGPHFTPTGHAVPEVRARVKTGVLVRDADVLPFAPHRGDLTQPTWAKDQVAAAREGYYKMRRANSEAAKEAADSEAAAGMCPGHPDIHHDSAACPTTGNREPVVHVSGDRKLEPTVDDGGTCDPSWCNCKDRSCVVPDESEGCDLCSQKWLFVLSAGGRTGSKSLLEGLNALPGVSLSGENFAVLDDLRAEFGKISELVDINGRQSPTAHFMPTPHGVGRHTLCGQQSMVARWAGAPGANRSSKGVHDEGSGDPIYGFKELLQLPSFESGGAFVSGGPHLSTRQLVRSQTIALSAVAWLSSGPISSRPQAST